MSVGTALWVAFWPAALIISVAIPSPWANGLIPLSAIVLGGWIRVATQERQQHRTNEATQQALQEEQ